MLSIYTSSGSSTVTSSLDVRYLMKLNKINLNSDFSNYSIWYSIFLLNVELVLQIKSCLHFKTV